MKLVQNNVSAIFFIRQTITKPPSLVCLIQKNVVKIRQILGIGVTFEPCCSIPEWNRLIKDHFMLLLQHYCRVLITSVVEKNTP